ncbi:sialate O-acetylesterase [Parabacteroides sp. PF5-6]|uniref:sialate O-acetylesterase n=1 Tax=Parabacteroides sp. PF5-6 TaxID=1742403 RepID=UPI00240775E8|nr:sialate O-acetylesterase [Parabacteroides sp. PF5-6]MDF9830315.1 sialate O-acetylesterase [Parabacteroides sp. PF5-6]
MKRVLLLWICLLPCLVMAEVRLPAVFSSHMVMQRDQKVNVWGWADKNERVEVLFNGQTKRAKADAEGKWTVQLEPMKQGGPYTLTVKGRANTIILTDILLGDIWVCSGQSNMEWTVKDVNDAAREIAEANHPMIRSFNVVKNISFKPLDALEGEWTVCSPTTVPDYSAVGYFFARKLHQETGVPIGIINSSWGGTDVETWTSADAFNTLPGEFKKRYEAVAIPADLDGFLAENERKKELYLQALAQEKGLREEWFAPTHDISAWRSLEVPKLWAQTELGDTHGMVWFNLDLTLPAGVDGKAGELSLGMIDDNEITWVNGVKVGETNGYNLNRVYAVPAGVLKEGQNRIAVRVYDTGGGAGFYSESGQLSLKIDGRTYPLAGQWKYREGATNQQFGYQEFSPNLYPSLLYNAMIHPIIAFAMKGAIWYQGENNAGAAYHYRTLFPLMINDWRAKWGREFPFYWVQLANYMAKEEQPVDSDWAKLREAQTMTLSLPQTGEAVIIDIGEADDIHPRNKQDVGLRLALNALNKDYGFTDIAYASPIYRSMDIQGDRAIITFDHADQGLSARNKHGYVEGFAIAGSDRKFYWAKAVIEGNKVIVQSDQVKNPVAVRYGWANNPDVNLYNAAGLPATPFRTDDW